MRPLVNLSPKPTNLQVDVGLARPIDWRIPPVVPLGWIERLSKDIIESLKDESVNLFFRFLTANLSYHSCAVSQSPSLKCAGKSVNGLRYAKFPALSYIIFVPFLHTSNKFRTSWVNNQQVILTGARSHNFQGAWIPRVIDCWLRAARLRSTYGLQVILRSGAFYWDKGTSRTLNSGKHGGSSCCAMVLPVCAAPLKITFLLDMIRFLRRKTRWSEDQSRGVLSAGNL